LYPHVPDALGHRALPVRGLSKVYSEGGTKTILVEDAAPEPLLQSEKTLYLDLNDIPGPEFRTVWQLAFVALLYTLI
jgi:hypothetical protein